MKLLQFIFAHLLYSIDSVIGHGYLNQPSATYVDPTTKTTAVAIVNGPQLYPDLKWNDSPAVNSKHYQLLISNNRIPDLRTFYSKYVNGCPNNVITNVVDVSNIKTMKWQNDEFREGFTPSHTGPCEAWIDDVKVFSNNDCAATYKSYPAELSIDFSICKTNTCLFVFYWIGLHEPNWQLYKACVTIRGRGGGTVQSNKQQTQITVDTKKYTCTST